MKASEVILVDKDILGGTPVFKGTRVPVKNLFDYLEGTELGRLSEIDARKFFRQLVQINLAMLR